MIKGIKHFIVILIFLALSIPLVSHCVTQNNYYIKTFGINLVPTKEHTPWPHSFYYQGDEKWKDDRMGASKFTLKKHGCLISITATSLNHLGINGNLKNFNDLFTKEKIYNKAGEIVWFRLSKKIKGIFYQKLKTFDSDKVERDLSQNRLPMVMVKNPHSGSYHWVLIVGADKKEFLIIDALRKDKKISGLSSYGKVFAYRALYKKKK